LYNLVPFATFYSQNNFGEFSSFPKTAKFNPTKLKKNDQVPNWFTRK